MKEHLFFRQRSFILLIKELFYARLLIQFCCSAFVVLLSSCSSNIVTQRELPQNAESETKYSIIFVIHGDGDYLYHDTGENDYNADEEALRNAKEAAMQNPYAEVFIFHQQPQRHFLFFFPCPDGEFYYYRNGQLTANESYRRNQEKSSFDIESALYRRFHLVNQNKLITMFLYFGHEIPEFGGAGYDESYPERTFTIDDLTNGLKGFTSDSSRFDLLILSTCFGGTPYTISKLGEYTRTIIASPENLHLSYFDFHSLERLDLSFRDGDVNSFAKRFARQSFDKLTGAVQTEVSVAVYEVDSVQNYLNSVQKDYNHSLDNLKGKTQDLAIIKHCDCADIPAYIKSTMNKGVDVLYRPARFGRSKNKQGHSGWECWKY